MNMGTLSRFVLGHKLLVTIVWVLMTAAGFASVAPASDALSVGFEMPGSESTETNAAIVETYGNGGSLQPLVAVLTLPEEMTVDSPGVRDELRTAFDQVVRSVPGTRIVSYASTGDRLFVSDDGRTTFGLIYPRFTGGFESSDVPALRSALDAAQIQGTPFQLTGMTELEGGGGEEGNGGVLIETLVGGLGALVVLGWVFGSFLAFVPLLIAAISIVTTFLLIWGLTAFFDVSAIVLFLISLIGLGVAIDYSLLVVTRWREERAAGRENQAAVQRAMETAGHAVIFSGTTVAIGLLVLVALPIPSLRSVGVAGILIPLTSVVVSITLLPVLLATVGPRLDWPRFRRGDQFSRAWARLARLVVRRRWLASAVALTLLAALIVPAFSLELGQPRAESLASSGEAHDGFVALQRAGITDGVLSPFEVSVVGTDPAAAADALGNVDGVSGAVAPAGDAWQKDDSGLVVVVPDVDSNTAEGREVLDRVRDAAHELPGQVRVAGASAVEADFIAELYANAPLLLGLVVFITFLLLVRAFRSLLLPLKAVILNILSVGAAYGVMVLVWQEGYGSEAIWGIEATGAIVSGIPLMAFAFLFGLSMDYEVFILSRMREEYDATGNTDEAVVQGMGHTGRLVSSAALILCLAFVAMGSVPDTTAKIVATGLAAGILLDATIIRALLVPATVSLMGRWNWWLPRWLERFIPHPVPLPAPVRPKPASAPNPR